MLVKGEMCGLVQNLVEIYASQVRKKFFFAGLMNKIERYVEGNLILMGDFNAVVDRELDKSMRTAAHSVVLQIFKKWLRESEVIDVK